MTLSLLLFPRRLLRLPARALLLLTIAASPCAAGPDDTIATFSIVAWDSTTGDLGIAVQSKFFTVGSVVPWAKAGVGAIATQSFANTTYGPRGLELLGAGKTPDEVMAALTADDAQKDQRQVGIVDAKGRATSYTGSACLNWAGGKAGVHYACQGNILTGADVVLAMAKTFESTPGMLGDRLLAALDAGQAAGGDSRGMQSAALLIVRDKGGYGGFNDRYCDLRVDDAENPFVELRRLYNLWKPNALIHEGYTACEAKDFEKAFRLGREALAIDSSSGQSQYHLACYYSKAGNKEEAIRLLTEAVGRDKKLAVQARTDTDFTPLKGDDRFVALVGTGD
jgi:uncharacterized Ntn-hydrolase superfamily protein